MLGYIDMLQESFQNIQALNSYSKSNAKTLGEADVFALTQAMNKLSLVYNPFVIRFQGPSYILAPRWRVMECGGGGNCFFHSVGRAINEKAETVRKWVADCVSIENVDRLLEYYTHVYPVGNWNRAKIAEAKDEYERVALMRQVFSTMGGSYLGDDTTMRLLVNHSRNLGFIVMRRDGSVHPQVFVNKNSKHLIVLMYLPGHWQLVGFCQTPEETQTTFDPFHLPAFLKKKLKTVQVDMNDFKDWEPRLELEKKA